MGDLMCGGDSAALAIRAHLAVPDGVDSVVLDGVRLRSEAAYLRQHGYVGVSIEAPVRIRQERLSVQDGSPFVPAHPTEVEAECVPVDFALSTDTLDFDELELRLTSLLVRCLLPRWRYNADNPETDPSARLWRATPGITGQRLVIRRYGL